jgi:hypothetical protein
MRYLMLFALQMMLFFEITAQNTGSFISQFSSDSLVKTVRELSGEDSVIINGTKTIIKNRAAYLGSNFTEDYLKARLAGYNLTVQTQKYSINGLNIFGIQKGSKYPDEVLIIGAHHDAVTNYCADDNASGVAAVMETARILSRNCFEYTVIYAFWDEEEAGLWGSTYHAKQAKANGQVFRGIINMDMLGYDSNNDRKFDIHVYPDPVSLSLADSIKSIIKRYDLNLDPQIINPGSDRGDHYSYWRQGIYSGIAYGERIFTDDPNPAYHSENDRIGLFNLPYFYELSKMTIGLTAALANPCTTSVSKFQKECLLRNADIYPNPASREITINLKHNMKTEVFISDISGRILFEGNFNEPVFTINLNKLPDGIYLVSITNNVERVTRKISKIQ